MVQTPSLWVREALLPSGWAQRVRIRIDAGWIEAVERDVDPEPSDERHALAVAGLPNVHSHAFQRGMAGLAEYRGPQADDFWTWREAMYRFLDRLGPDDVEAIAAQAYVEMLEAGYTRVGEFHYLHHSPDGRPYANLGELAERIGAAAAQTGIGLTLLPVLYAHAGFGGTAPSHGQRRFICDLDTYARLVEGARRICGGLPDGIVGVAPHSLRAVTPDELKAALALAPDDPIHIHAAEQVREVEDSVAWSGRRPVEWLLEHAAVDRRWCLVHATHMTATETSRLAATGAVAGLCPITESNLGDGHFPAVNYLRAGGHFGIGTDSNVRIDAGEELRTLEYSQRLLHRARNVLGLDVQRSTGRLLFDAAVAGGTRALGAMTLAEGIETAGLVADASADIVTFSMDHPALASRTSDAIVDSWIFTGGRDVVDCVWRQGRKVVESGGHVEREAVAARYRRVMAELMK